jgi:hypothetical protein
MKQLIPRKFERKRCVGEARVRQLPDGPSLAAQVLDLGQSGLALFVDQSLAKGQLVEVMFRVGQPAAKRGLDKRVGRVVRSRANSDGNVAGIAFSEPLDEDEFRLLEKNWIRS